MKANTHAQQLFLILLILTFVTGACSSSRNISGSAKKGLALKYKFESTNDLKYLASTDFTQVIEANGQQISTELNYGIHFKLHPNERSKESVLLNVFVDSMTLSISSSQGKMEPDMKNVNGKSFNLILSDHGESLDASGAESLTYEISPGVERNLKMTFSFLFPQMPDHKVKIGDSWTHVDTIVDAAENEKVEMVLSGNFLFEGIETVDGIECAKISGTYTGTRKGNSETQGMTISSSGQVKGMGMYYFAIANGYLLKDDTETTINGVLDIQGPENLSLPMIYNYKNRTRLID